MGTGRPLAAGKQRKKAQEQLVQTELRFFQHTKGELKQIQKMMVMPVSTPTLLHMEKTVNAIETALERTRNMPEGDARIKILQLKYWGCGQSSTGIMMDVHVAKSTYYKWHKDFVKMVGELMGM